jgi:regulator of sirC expression with transglutaminase-like and TPR domain
MNQPDNKGPGAEGFRQEFARAITRPEEDLDLGRAALLIAGEEYPDLDVPKYLQLLDRYAAAVQERAPHTLPPEERAIQLGAYLFGELGFHGNSSDYYNPENSYFNRVLETKSGIPISLSLLFIEVGRRIGLRLHGIGMPGHFLVGLEGRGAFFDPFNGGEALSSADCRQLAERLFGERLTWDDQYLEPCTKYEFLFRILNNLKVVYERTDAPQKAVGVVQRMIMVRPDATTLYQDMAALQQGMQQYRAAMASLESYLKERQEAPDAPQVKAWINSLRTTLSRLN